MVNLKLTSLLLRGLSNLLVTKPARPLDAAPNAIKTVRYAMKPLEPCPEDSPLHGIRGIRHCAFCLKPCSTVACCSGCHRRAYCSVGCQDKDWRVGEGGQGHSIWCSLGCGEEDLDWEVRPAPGKGLGVFALRDFPRFTRIMAEGPAEDTHAAIADLMPVNASIAWKMDFNGYGKHGFNNKLYLRTARMNHDCRPNAYLSVDPSPPHENVQSAVVYSTRDIKAGDEITMAYQFFNDPLLYKDALPTPQEVQFYLKVTHGIVCPADCYCRDPVVYSNCRKAVAMVHRWEAAMVAGQADEVMDLAEALLAMGDIIDVQSNFRYSIGFQTALHIAGRPADGRCKQKAARMLEQVVLPLGQVMYNPASGMGQYFPQFYKEVMTRLK